MKTIRWFAVGSLLALTGCAGVISKELRAQALPIRGLAEIRANPDPFKGRTVILGGEIIETRNQPQGTTLMVLAKPLDAWDMPEARDESDGRFLVEVAGYLDPIVFARGRALTVAGPVMGVRTEPVGEALYSYVVLQGEEVHLWGRERYPPYSPPYGLWDDPFWDPWPWGWGPDRRHHRR